MIDWRSQRQGNDSMILLTMGVREIGRKFESISRAGKVLGIGETVADFHEEGMKR